MSFEVDYNADEEITSRFYFVTKGVYQSCIDNLFELENELKELEELEELDNLVPRRWYEDKILELKKIIHKQKIEIELLEQLYKWSFNES